MSTLNQYFTVQRANGARGHSYNGQFRKKVKPASPAERVASIQRRMDELIDMLAGAITPDEIESLHNQIAFQKVCLDRAMEAVR